MNVGLDSLAHRHAEVNKQTQRRPSSPPLARRQFSFSPWMALPVPSATHMRDKAGRVPTVSILERAAALLLLILISPLMLLIALAIKLDSPRGPVLYRQERVGLDRRCRRAHDGGSAESQNRRAVPGAGQLIMICKFRTMIPNAESKTGPVWASARDPRVTRLGAILRQLRIDELPQLFNIVQGQMRLIGPRPERPHFVSKLVLEIPDYAQRQRVHPGITGLAQVERHYDSCVEDVQTKLKYDLFYVNNRCGLMDLKILFKTVDVMVRGKGAR
jgi:lipopolysaccharide/colanic/teichoic acid biosynthesis glycosyltransferase